MSPEKQEKMDRLVKQYRIIKKLFSYQKTRILNGEDFQRDFRVESKIGVGGEKKVIISISDSSSVLNDAIFDKG